MYACAFEIFYSIPYVTEFCITAQVCVRYAIAL